jgi:hypothetical protein
MGNPLKRVGAGTQPASAGLSLSIRLRIHSQRRDIMPFWRLYYHLVWSTKNREHFISPAVEDQLYAYIVNKAAELDVRVYAING